MTEIKSNNLDDYHEGHPVVDTVSDGTLNDSNEGIALTGYEIPSVVQLTSPLSGSTGESIPVTLTWEEFVGASLYQVQVATTDVFDPGDIVLDETTVNEYYNVTSLDINYNTIYYWRVRAEI